MTGIRCACIPVSSTGLELDENTRRKVNCCYRDACLTIETVGVPGIRQVRRTAPRTSRRTHGRRPAFESRLVAYHHHVWGGLHDPASDADHRAALDEVIAKEAAMNKVCGGG